MYLHMSAELTDSEVLLIVLVGGILWLMSTGLCPFVASFVIDWVTVLRFKLISPLGFL